MIRISFVVLLFVVSLWSSQSKVAVFPFTGSGVTKNQIEMVYNRVSEKIGTKPMFTLVDRQHQRSLMEERRFQESGLVSDADIISDGRMFGAQYGIIGTITQERGIMQLALRLISIETGTSIPVSENSRSNFNTFLETSVNKAVDAIEHRVALDKGYGSVEIRSNPSGASALLDKKHYGVTPFTTGFMKPGFYTLSLQRDRYTPLSEQIEIKQGYGHVLNFEMALSDKYRKKRRRPLQIGLGVASLGGLVAGLVMEKNASDNIGEKERLYEKYMDTKEAAVATELSTQIKALDTSINDDIKKRNILFGLSGASLVGLSLTFVF